MTADGTSPRATLRWTVHPAAQSPARAVVVCLIVAVAGLFGAAASGSPGVGLACGAALLVSLRAFFLPRTYALDPQGASESGALTPARRLGWDEVRRISTGRFGVHLSPRLHTSRWLPDRGLFLRTAGNADEVARFAEEHRATS